MHHDAARKAFSELVAHFAPAPGGMIGVEGEAPVGTWRLSLAIICVALRAQRLVALPMTSTRSETSRKLCAVQAFDATHANTRTTHAQIR